MELFQPIKKNTPNEKTVISVRVNSEVLLQIDKLSGDIDVSRNEFINQCLDYALEHISFENNKDKK